MAINLKIDPKLLEEALEVGGFKTKKDAVNQALAEFIQYRRQMAILQLEGKVEYRKDYDYKKLRRAR